MRNRFIIAASICLYLIFGFSHNSAQSQVIINKISKSVGFLSFEDKTKPDSGGGGTGTLFLKPWSDSTARVFIITNRHVLPTFSQNSYVNFKIRNDSLKKNTFVEVYIQLFDSKGKYQSAVQLDPDGSDLAIIDITSYFFVHPEYEHLLDNALTYGSLGTKEAMVKNQIEVGDEVLFIGYPSFLFDKRNMSPIVRHGIIATSPNEPFYLNDLYRSNYLAKFGELLPENMNIFLIDANAAGGSSGSLVVTKPKHFLLKEGNMQTYVNPNGYMIVIGILTNSFFDLDSRLTGTQRVNIGGVILASQITKTIDLFLSRHP